MPQTQVFKLVGTDSPVAATRFNGVLLLPLQVIQDFCASSQHLKQNSTDWVQVKRARTAAQAGQQQQFQQHLQQFRLGSQPGLPPNQPGPEVMTQLGPGASQVQPGQEGLQAGLWVAARGATDGAAPSAAAAAGAATPWWQQGQQQEQAAADAAPLLTADAEVYQGLLYSKVLAEPKKAAQAAWEQWQQGMTVAQIATEGREKPIQVWLFGRFGAPFSCRSDQLACSIPIVARMQPARWLRACIGCPLLLLLLLPPQESTVLGYLAEAAAAYGCSLQRVQQLQEAAGLAGAAGGSNALLWRLVSALNSNRGASLSILKNNLPADITYGQIKV